MHERRSECFLSIHDYLKAISDLKALSKLVPDNTDAYYRISEISYALGDAETGLNNIRECVKLDSDNKRCSELYKKLKKLSKLLDNMRKAQDEENYVECVNNAKKIKTDFADSYHFRSKAQSQICICSSKVLDQAVV
jgi:DnaJ family protein C protein 3